MQFLHLVHRLVAAGNVLWHRKRAAECPVERPGGRRLGGTEQMRSQF